MVGVNVEKWETSERTVTSQVKTLAESLALALDSMKLNVR